MNFSFDAMMVRAGDALTALVVMIMMQVILIGVAKGTRRAIPPMPILEIILRPFAVKLCDRLNRSDRTDFALMVRGMIVFFFLFAAVVAVFLGIDYVVHYFQSGLSFLPLLLILSPVLSLPVVLNVSKGHGFRGLATGLNQNLIPTDDYGMRREGAKLLSLSLTDWFIFPLIIFIVLGAPFLWVFVALSLFIRVSSTPSSPFLLLFEKIYAGVTIILNSVIFPILFLAAVFAAGGHPLKLIRALTYPRNMVLAGFAYGQDMVLGGSYQTRLGQAVKAPWIGEEGATAKLDHKAVLRLVIMHAVMVFLIMISFFIMVMYF